ncbi:MAG TPA: molybdenum cofactor biosynthesis protein MoaE [Methanosarcinales archaeon]|nr:molybdenum cofactor biosynthesis protein MoaE [Methanosarcinales archaeon]
MIAITEEDFNIDKILTEAKHPDNGAIVTFLGIVRDDGIVGMDIEAYTDLAMQELDRIEREALEQFDIRSLDVIHRTGTLSVSDNILLIVCGAPHRKDAFAACEYVIDELKERVPVWKKELYINGAGGKWVGDDTE